MTIICFDGTTLAADRQYTWEEEGTVAHYGNKIESFPGWVLAFAACGAEEDSEKFRGWLLADLFPSQFKPQPYPKLGKDFSALVLEESGCRLYTSDPSSGNKVLGKVSIGHDPAVHYARALLDLGLSASDAVLLASSYSIHCGGGFDSVKIAKGTLYINSSIIGTT
jgi:hypothetical protein